MSSSSDDPSTPQSPLSLYRRLWRYACRYRFPLLIGLIAGALYGASMYPLLQQSSNVLAMFDEPPVLTATNGVVSLPTQIVATAMAPVTPKMPKWQRVGQKWADFFGVTFLRNDGQITWQAALLAMLIIPVVIVVRILAMCANDYCLRWLGARVVRDLRDDLFASMQMQSLQYHGKMDVGRMISRNISDTGIIENVINSAATEVSRAPFTIVFVLLFIINFSRERHMFGLLGLTVVAFPLLVIPLVVLGRRVRTWTRKALERISDLVSLMHENLTCIRVVKAFHMEAAEAVRFNETNKRYFKTVMRAVRIEIAFNPLMEAMGVCIGCAFMAVCLMQGLRLTELLPIAGAALLIYPSIRSLAKIIPIFERGAAALARIFETLDLDMRLPEASNSIRKTAFTGRIVFEDVSFQYSTSGDPVIRHASFAVPRGGMVAVVGATGSGKTTLANLLARFYDPTAGCVQLDGTDLRDIRIADLRKLVGVLTQETVLFNETIAYNIAYGTEGATPAEIQAAAEKANAHAFITAHPDGYNRVVGEKGFVLSGGERQRIAIARIMLRNPPILILDEATSALDTVTERQVQEEIALAMANRTTFAIAHRLSTIRRANLILVVDKGVIVERGTHDELYAANGAYRHLCDIQFSQGSAGGQG